MKIYIYIILFLIFTLNLYSGGDSLIAYWSFDDGTAKDFSGNGYDGTIVNHPTVIDGISGKALHFQGRGYQINESQSVTEIGDHILLPPIDLTKFTGFTISMWVREQNMIKEGEAYIFFGHFDRGWLGIENTFFTLNNSEQYYLQFTTNGQGYSDFITTPFLNNYQNQWVHYAIVYKNKTLYAYINGSLIDTLVADIKYSMEHFALLRHWWYYGNQERSSARFTGDIDEVKIFSKALSEDEVKKLANPCENYFTFSVDNNNKSLEFDSVGYATTSCRQISITNISNAPQIVDKTFLKYNIDFSVPQSQIPLIIQPQETKTLSVCLTPTRLGNIVDTLIIPNNCDTLHLPLSGIGSPNYYNTQSKCDVSLAGKTIDIINGGYLNVNTEYLENSQSLQIFINTSIDGIADCDLYIYNYLGQEVKKLISKISFSKISNKQYNCEYSVPLFELSKGIYLIKLTIENNNYFNKIYIY